MFYEMYLQTLGELAFRGDPAFSQLNQGPQKKTLERLTFILLEKEVSREQFIALFFPYADDPQRDLRRAVKNLNAYVETKGFDQIVLLEPKSLKANLTTDVDLLDECLLAGDLDGAVALYEGAFLLHITKGNNEFRSWVFEKRRRIAKRLLDALSVSLEGDADVPASLLTKLWLLFEHATDFPRKEAEDDLDSQEAKQSIQDSSYVQNLLERMYRVLDQHKHQDVVKVMDRANDFGLQLNIASLTLNTGVSVQQETFWLWFKRSSLNLLWLFLGLFVAFMSYGYFAASRAIGYIKPHRVFELMSKYLAPFWGLVVGGFLFAVFLFFSVELLKHRRGRWFERLPVFDFLPRQLSVSFRRFCCAFVLLVVGVWPFWAQTYFFQNFYGFEPNGSLIYSVNRHAHGGVNLQDRYTPFEPAHCNKNLTCIMLLTNYPIESIWERSFVYGNQAIGEHFDYYPYVGPYLIIVFYVWLLLKAIRVLLLLFNVDIRSLLMRFKSFSFELLGKQG